METIGKSSLYSFVGQSGLSEFSNVEVRKRSAYEVDNYLDLATKVAELQYKNPNYVMLFRGQNTDYRDDQGYSSLNPSIFRSRRDRYGSWETFLEERFRELKNAEKSLIRQYQGAGLPDNDRLKRYRILRWSLLQHYEICGTPLLDVTHSLRIAASFASMGMPEDAFIYVLGVPNLSGSVTASAESGLQVIRLSSVCPPNALRPHLQEGYLLGEYPDMGDPSQKENYPFYQIDFGRRIITKFRFNPKTFWDKSTFPKVANKALYPDQNDPLFELAQNVKDSIANH